MSRGVRLICICLEVKKKGRSLLLYVGNAAPNKGDLHIRIKIYLLCPDSRDPRGITQRGSHFVDSLANDDLERLFRGNIRGPAIGVVLPGFTQNALFGGLSLLGLLPQFVRNIQIDSWR